MFLWSWDEGFLFLSLFHMGESSRSHCVKINAGSDRTDTVQSHFKPFDSPRRSFSWKRFSVSHMHLLSSYQTSLNTTELYLVLKTLSNMLSEHFIIFKELFFDLKLGCVQTGIGWAFVFIQENKADIKNGIQLLLPFKSTSHLPGQKNLPNSKQVVFCLSDERYIPYIGTLRTTAVWHR